MKKHLNILCSILLLVIIPSCVNAQLHAGFTARNTSGCPPLVTHFTNLSTGSPVYSHWVFDNLSPGDTSNLSNPNWIYSAPGYYDVKLVVEDASGNWDSITLSSEIFVAHQPVVDFVASDTILSCPPQTIVFTNLSDTGGCSPYFTWFIDSGYYHTTNASYTFTTPGYYNISLRETDSCGCAGYISKTAYVKIDSFPIMCYHSPDSTPCSYPATICFDNCTMGGVYYLWKFGDGTTDSVRNPCHEFTYSSTFSDTLIASSLSGCTSTLIKPADIRVGSTFINIHTVPAAPCRHTPIACVDTVAGTIHHYWRFTTYEHDTMSYDPSPIFMCDTQGMYLLSDSIWTDLGCAVNITLNINVKPTPKVWFTADNYYRCTPNDTATFSIATTDTSGIASYFWNLGDSASGYLTDTSSYAHPIHIYTVTGFYSPTLNSVDSAGCLSDTTITNYVGIFPTSDTLHIYPSSGCVPLTVRYQAFVYPYYPYITDSVSFGDGTPSGSSDTGYHTYTVAGYYNLTHYYHFASGCSDSFASLVMVGNHATFETHVTPDSSCPNLPMTFFGHCDNCIRTWWQGAGEWSSDGFTSDSATFTFGYSGPGHFNYFTDDSGCIDTNIVGAYIYPPDSRALAAIVNCDDRFTIKFHVPSAATSYLWNFGDGATSTDSTPVHTYAADGHYLVTISDTDSYYGCWNSGENLITIAPFPPAVTVSDTSICPGTLVTFPLPPDDLCNIDYGDGTAASVSSAYRGYFENVYRRPGRYTVTLQLTNSWTCSDTIVQTGLVYVENPGHGFRAETSYGCAPFTVHFIDTTATLTGVPVHNRQWEWFIGSSPIHGLSQDTTFTYPEGNYTAVLIDTDIDGCASVAYLPITVVKPHAYFTTPYTMGCIDRPIPFYDTNTHASYTWYFGDGSGTGSGQNPTHVYSVNGEYTDTVIITTLAGGGYPAGCLDTFVRTNYVNISDTSIRVGFNLSDTLASCPPFITLATNTTDPTTGIYYKWKYGFDSSTIDYTLLNATAVYTYPGNYVITLIDSSALGCLDSLKKGVHIGGPRGIITISPDSICAPGFFHLHVTNIGTSPLDSLYNWFIPPYGAYTTDTPGIIMNYSAVGSYNPYVVIDSNGCQVAIHTIDSIYSFPRPDVTVNHPLPSCTHPVTLFAAGGDSYIWSPDSTLSCDTCTIVYADPHAATVYTVTGNNRHGCTDTAIALVIIDPPRTINIAGRHNVCLGDCDTLAASGISGIYEWSGPGLACNFCSQTIACTPASAVYTLETTDTFGCHDTTHYTIDIRPLPVIYLNPTPAWVCVGKLLQLSAQGAASYVWRPNINITCDSCDSPSVLGVSNLVYTVMATSTYGCRSTENMPLTVIQHGSYWVSPDTTICLGKSVDLVAAGGGDGYLWMNPIGLSSNISPYPVATPQSTITYMVIIKENVCFSDTGYITVTVAQYPELSVPPPVTIIAGSQVQLKLDITNGVHIGDFLWSPANTLTCSNCHDPVATPTENTTYSVTVTSVNGCAVDTTITINMYCDRSEVFIPNTFTPNKDGVNDQFYISGKGISNIKRMSVFNRWGELVFERQNIQANDPNAGWDGTYKGSILAPDAFIYIVDAECELGQSFHFQGDISIVR